MSTATSYGIILVYKSLRIPSLSWIPPIEGNLTCLPTIFFALLKKKSLA
jgi:hypothetical protein